MKLSRLYIEWKDKLYLLRPYGLVDTDTGAVQSLESLRDLSLIEKCKKMLDKVHRA